MSKHMKHTVCYLQFDFFISIHSKHCFMFQVIKNLVESDPPPQIDCASACAARCQLSSRPNLCHRACGTCCARCSCVPPGTSGNYDACPCYGNMTTHHGQHKCP
ncbi:hypothetical protein OIU76_001340 [Salix suchowensis]|nr:hypothetical protein OIU76_001340 [Salix suchowensis]